MIVSPDYTIGLTSIGEIYNYDCIFLNDEFKSNIISLYNLVNTLINFDLILLAICYSCSKRADFFYSSVSFSFYIFYRFNIGTTLVPGLFDFSLLYGFYSFFSFPSSAHPTSLIFVFVILSESELIIYLS